MKVTLLPSSVSPGDERHQFLTSFLIGDHVAVDAGSLGLLGSTEAQARVRHVFLTHTHVDHIASLPLFVENVFEAGADCPTIYGGAAVLDCLKRDVFNDRVWPDFLRMGSPESPFLKLVELTPERPVEVEGLRVTPVEVNHIVPTMGMVLHEPGATVVIAGDTGPTERIWEIANAAPDLRAVFLESAFPDELEWLADASKHLTPALFAAEAAKVSKNVRLFSVHIKPKFIDRIAAELAAQGLAAAEICRPGRIYEF